MAHLVAVSHPYLADARIVGACRRVAAPDKFEFLRKLPLGRGCRDRIEIVRGLDRAQSHRRNARRAARNTGGDARRLENLLRTQVVRVRVARLVARENTNTATHRKSLRSPA